MTERIGAPLEVTVRPAGDGVHVVEVSGDLVVTNRSDVGAAIERVLDGGGRAIVVDAHRLTHVDTPSLALLVRLAGRCRETGGELAVAALPPTFEPLVRALRLEEALAFTDTVDEALERLGA